MRNGDESNQVFLVAMLCFHEMKGSCQAQWVSLEWESSFFWFLPWPKVVFFVMPIAAASLMTGNTPTICCWVLLLLSFCWQKILNSAALTIAWHGYSLIYTARCGLGLLQQAFHCPMCVYDRKNGSKFCYVRVVQGKVRGMVHELDMSFCQNSNEQAWLSVLLVMAAECVYNCQQKWSRML